MGGGADHVVNQICPDALRSQLVDVGGGEMEVLVEAVKVIDDRAS
jgi:hypothetical protein